jgi:flagellar export protein FliJ
MMEAVVSSNHGRVKRLQRLASIIQRKLDLEVAALARARQQQSAAQHRIQAIATQLEEAIRTATDELAPGQAAEQWRVLFGWQESLRASAQAAAEHEQQCKREVEAARSRVLIAREELHRMDSLIQRVIAAHRAEEARRDRRREDETYAALASPARGLAGATR